ncbi:trimeric intracellular cation channel family protein [Helicobacter pametensis]|uniref:trimeric intracellular cation channel family protein n=1 Tax=Helicobacter pametensis TaxID=95149 RepID=UPI000489221A|nr:trimeric intracellular cation channel family protein [Helicobacter pametensis]
MIISILFYIGIIAESMSGALAAGRHKMDLFGVFFISFATALGGGSIRDVLFDHHPLLWVQSPHYVLVVLVSSLLATRIAYFINRLERLFLTLDALGLAVFSTIGAKIIIGMGYDLTLAMIAAVVTGSFGGILRDLFCNSMPLVFRKELYAFVAMLCGALYWFAFPIFGEEIATLISISIGFLIRMIAIRYKISLPTFIFEAKEKL